MKRGRRTLKRSVLPEQVLTFEECQCIAKVISLRRSNRTEIMDARIENSLELFPAKFRNILWIRRGAVFKQKRKPKRMIIRRRGRDMCPIPQDLVIEILIRLPPNSLVRSKCVSKQWSSLISRQHFFNRLFTVTRQQQPHLYMCLVDNKAGKRVLLSISSSPDNTCLVVDQDLSISGMGGYYVNVVRGLMGFSKRNKACIYNPTTRQRLTLPAINSDITPKQGHNMATQYYIGHDPVNDQYKILCTIVISTDRLLDIKSEHWVFVLEAGGSWKKVVLFENYRPHFPDTVAQIINGSVIHYMSWLNIDTCAIVSFDVRSEKVTTILVPREAGDVGLKAINMKAGLIEYGGTIAVFDHSRLKDKGLADLWILNNAEKKGWSKERRVVQPSQMHLVNDIDFNIKGTTQDDKVILAPAKMSSQFYILCYDMRNNDLRKVEIKGVPHLWFDKKCYFDLTVMDESGSVIYLET